MNEENVTGLNPEQVKSDLNAFVEYGRGVYSDMRGALVNFNSALYDNWCSPRAKDFSGSHIHKLFARILNLDSTYRRIYRSAVDAYNILARSQGLETIEIGDQSYEDYDYGSASGNDLTDLRDKNENGVVGIVKANVEMARDLFLEAMGKAIQKAKDTPMNIAFYDPEGKIAESYKTEISKYIGEINLEIDDAVTLLNNQLNEETNTFMIASAAAADAISGGAGNVGGPTAV